MQNVQYFVLGYEDREYKIAEKYRSTKKNVIFYNFLSSFLFFITLYNGIPRP